MKTLYHHCGQALDVIEKIDGRPVVQGFIFLDTHTGDGYDRCPRCGLNLVISDFSCQAVRPVSQAKSRPTSSPAKREARKLIRRAYAVAARQQATA